MPNPKIVYPATYTPANAVAFANTDNSAATVSASTPLPVALGDGALAAMGSTTDTAAASDSATASLIALFKRLLGKFPAGLGQKTAAASLPVVLASDQGAITTAGVYNTAQPTLTGGQVGSLQLDSSGALAVRLQWSGGYIAGVSGNITDSVTNSVNTIMTLTRGFLFNGSTWDRQKKPIAVSRIASSAAGTNATVAKGGAGDLFAIQAYNTTASVIYLKLYNKAAAPTVGTDTPIKTIAIAPSASLATSATWANGLYFSTGIAYALTAAAADSDTSAIAAGAIVGLNLDYQ